MVTAYTLSASASSLLEAFHPPKRKALAQKTLPTRGKVLPFMKILEQPRQHIA